MKQVLTAAVAAAALAAGTAFAEAPELHVNESITIDAPIDTVWEMASDFAHLHRWYPLIESSRLVLGKNREVGAIRELRRKNGTKVEEKLIEFDPWNHTFTYTYAEGMPLSSDYFATMHLSEAGAGKTLVEWKARFKRLSYWTDEAPPGQEDATLTGMLTKGYKLGLENLKKLNEGDGER